MEILNGGPLFPIALMCKANQHADESSRTFWGYHRHLYTILEGYKVADKMKAHGVGGSTFSDWWAYSMMKTTLSIQRCHHAQSVTVAYNSDDAEMSRRLDKKQQKR